MNNVNVVRGNIVCSEVIISLSLPDSQNSISKIYIVAGVVLGQSGDEVPVFINTVRKSVGVDSEESQPESITIFLRIVQIRSFYIVKWCRFVIVSYLRTCRFSVDTSIRSGGIL